MSRRGQAGAAVLIVLIALMIILYVLFLPPAERDALLGDGGGSSGGGGGGSPPDGRPNVIFSAVPRVAEVTGPEVHSLPSFQLRTLTSGNLLAERSGLLVEHTAFHSTTESLSFSVPPNSQNVYLSFIALEANGDLEIALDGETIYSTPLGQRQPAPIALNAGPGTHSLEFGVSGVGFRIWDRNAYRLSDVRVTGDVTSFAQADQTQRFVITELDDIERAYLSFIPDCTVADNRLTVGLNGQDMYSGYPMCGVPLQQELAIGRLVDGENTLHWSISGGQYGLFDVAVIAERTPVDYQETFTISSELYNRVLSGPEELLLQLSFTGSGAEGALVLNDEELRYRTHKQMFAAPISLYVRPGANTITLTESTRDVVALEVLVE